MSVIEGFDHRRGTLLQLQKVLNVSNDQLAEIACTIKSLVSTRLDIDRQARFQMNELSGIGDRLRTIFPDIFDSSQRLAFARQVAMRYHRDARRRTATRSEKIQPCSGRRDNLSSNSSGKQRSRPSQLPSVGVGSQNSASSTRTSQRRALVDHRGSSSSRLSDFEYSEPIKQDGRSAPQQFKSRDTGINVPSCRPPLGYGQRPQVSVCKPTVTNRELDCSTPDITSSPCISDPTRSMTYIHCFLQDCSPPLGHLLSRFVDLGFQTQDLLREVAYVWTDEERRKLMKRLAPGPNGNKMTELELAALERGFQALCYTVDQ